MERLLLITIGALMTAGGVYSLMWFVAGIQDQMGIP